MKRRILVYMMSETSAACFELNGLSAIGGADSSGFVAPGLKYSDDYAVLSPDASGIAVHPLKGRTKGPIHLDHLQTATIGDLKLLVIVQETAEVASSSSSPADSSDDHFIESLQTLTTAFAEPQSWEQALQQMLMAVTDQFLMEKGLLIAQSAKSKFEIVAQKGLQTGDPWLSQTLVEETLRLRQPRIVLNLLGSEFESKKSLMATGFLSVFAWPLIMRGETLGVLLMGSARPHSGLNEKQQAQADTYARLATLLLHFHQRDQRLKEEIALLRNRITPSEYPLLTQDVKLQETCRLASQVAASNLGVLIQGETGVGKELLANWIHSQGDRTEKPFIAVNCGAIPSELLESLLFGHRKGAFTGAVQDQTGKFQLAHGGTLFLDEIGDLHEALQVKLLRVLQEGVVEPLGSNRPISVDVRVIAATHKSLPDLIAQGKFREDLYYRLAEITLRIPALRERTKDIGLLASHFLKTHAPNKRLSHGAWQWLQAQEWRGNVRELSSAVRRAAILSVGEEIAREDFLRGHSDLQSASAQSKEFSWLGGRTLEEARDSFVQSKIEEALRRTEGKRKEAAELLGITPRTLFRYLEDRRDRMTDVSHDQDRDVSL